MGLFSPDILLWIGRRVRGLWFEVADAFRDLLNLGRTPRDGAMVARRRNPISELQLRVLLPFVALPFCLSSSSRRQGTGSSSGLHGCKGRRWAATDPRRGSWINLGDG